LLAETPPATETNRRSLFRFDGVVTCEGGKEAPCEDAVVTERTLSRARAGDEEAFRQLIDTYRAELQLHCYRILGSVQDAEDLLQETLLAAWRGLEGFGGRASLRAWLYRIATNRCLNALRDRGRRPREVQPMAEPPEPTRRSEPLWLEPYPDALLDSLADTSPGPEARYELKEAVSLAFVTGLQRLPPRQRAVLALRDVLGFRASEVAAMLETTEAAVKGALQRARATLEARRPAGQGEDAPLPRSSRERELVGRFADAVESGDVDRVVALLTDDAWLTMPPQPFEYQGHAAIARFLEDRAALRGRPLRLVPTRANGQPAFGCYLPDAETAIARPYGLMVLTLERQRISAVTWFGDSGVFAYFRLPRNLRV
jgi:RNA polymerase sigma-70 factor (TIGR02960 family)